ncbi:lycopene cyclase [Brachybacterium phenoliresistens]|uniref:Lycopene cyclase n=1 Tax=Brachybacterium phenoliresistens TaxID=396014 RepID=Z9JUW0_9MICO|nr:lycopene cyclase domain-containing protein [Brachybacterium phenoliresistens]EWS81527.1 lycopene cyclase [Brachybacterium phenoliresistens]
MPAEYLIVLGLCLLITLPLEFVLGARVYRRPRRLLRALAPVVVVFVAWDLLGIHRGHWWYAPDKITGIMLPGRLPLEELLFFLVIPICGLLTLEGVRAVLTRAAALRAGLRERAGTRTDPTEGDDA